ncbi:ribulose kinase [Arthrobacter sp. CAN_C5]|nr:ribulose kinase [Arthrobacter sp. CAN_C5]
MDRVLAAAGERLPPQWALQVPPNYVDVLRTAVPEAVRAAGIDPRDVIGIATDFTVCTMTTADGTTTTTTARPLNELPGLETRPHAYVKLWTPGMH